MLQIGVGEVVPLVSSPTKESQRSSFRSHTGLVSGGNVGSTKESRLSVHGYSAEAKVHT